MRRISSRRLHVAWIRRSLVAGVVALVIIACFLHVEFPALQTSVETIRTDATEPVLMAQTPLPSPCVSPPPVLTPSLIPSPRSAYIVYVTDDQYACNGLIIAHRLQTELKKSPDIEIVAVVTEQVSQRFVNAFKAANVVVIRVSAWVAKGGDRTWFYSLTKLYIFADHGYRRLVYLDNDSWMLRNLDHLFDLPDAVMWAPRAYWLDQPFLNSQIIAFRQKNSTFSEIQNYFRESTRPLFDMDVLNDLYKNRAGFLPSEYSVLNSDFLKEKTRLADSGDELKNRTFVVHFSCKPNGQYGKPWNVPRSSLLSIPSGAHPFFSELFRLYWAATDKYCNPPEPVPAKT